MAQVNKTTKDPRSTKTAQSDEQPQPVASRWQASNLLWGGLLLLAGLLLLLDNLGLIDVSWRSIWQLWPVLIIIIGLSILKLRGWVAGVVYGLAAVVILAVTWAALAGTVGDDGKTSTDKSEEFSVSRSSDSVKSFNLNLETGAASLDISSTDKDDLLAGKSSGDSTTLDRRSTVDGDTQIVTLSQSRDWSWLKPVALNGLDIQLNQNIPTVLRIDAGASDIDADLSRVMLQAVLVDSGASSINLRLGDKLDQTDVRIDTGVSSVTIYVPKDSGVELNIDSGLSSKDMPSDYEKVDDDSYRSANHADSSKKISIDIDMGVSSFKLITY